VVCTDDLFSSQAPLLRRNAKRLGLVLVDLKVGHSPLKQVHVGRDLLIGLDTPDAGDHAGEVRHRIWIRLITRWACRFVLGSEGQKVGKTTSPPSRSWIVIRAV
jgi:hypothetical protein